MKRELPAEVMRLQQLIESARRRWIAARASGNVKRATRATCLQTAAERRLSTIKERAMQIRGATDNDLAEIRRIQEELVFAETGYRVGELEQNIVGLLSSGKNSGHQFVVFDDITQRIAGFVEFDPARAMIRAIGVSPGYQGRGIGRRLVRECLMQARAAKRERIGTTCTQPVSEFFEPLGFELETQSKITGPDGRHIDIFAMSRPVEDPFIQERIAALEASVQFFGAGEDKKQARELYVVKGFLRGLGMEFNDDEIVIPLQDPPDALFRDACFEVKELFQQGRLRGPEYKAALAKTRQAFWRDELFEHFTPRDIALADVAAEVTQLAGKYLGRRNYEPAKRAGFDLLVYANLEHVRGIDPAPLPDLTALRAQGWRSVSFFRGNAVSCVLVASESAPEFIREASGLLLHAGEKVVEAC